MELKTKKVQSNHSRLRFLLSAFCFQLLAFPSNAQEPKLMLPIGHTKNINTLSISPDSKRVLTSSDDFTARIWDMETGFLLSVLFGHTDKVNSASYSPDGSKIITVSSDQTAKLWDARTGQHIQTLNHAELVYSAVFSPKGDFILTSSEDRKAYLWHGSTGKFIKDLKGHSGPVYKAAFSPDGNRIVTSSADKTAKVWDVKAGNLISTLKGIGQEINTTAFSPDGKNIVTFSVDGIAVIWDAVTFQPKHTFDNIHPIPEPPFSADGKHVFMTTAAGKGNIVDLSSGKIVTTLDTDLEMVQYASFLENEANIITVSANGVGQIWDISTGELMITLHNTFIFQLSPDLRRIITANANGATIFDTNTPDWRKLNDLIGHTEPVLKTYSSPDKTTIAVLSMDAIQFWDMSIGKLIRSFALPRGYIQELVFLPGGKSLAALGTDNAAILIDINTGEVINKAVNISHISFSPNGKRSLTINDKGLILQGELGKSQIIARLEGHTSAALTANFSSDNKSIITASYDSTAKIWDAESGKLLVDLKGHTNWVTFADFSHNAKMAMTVSSDSTIRIWDVENGKPLQRIKVVNNLPTVPDGIFTSGMKISGSVFADMIEKQEGHSKVILSASFSPDDKKLIFLGKDDHISIADVQTGKIEQEYKSDLYKINDARFMPNSEKVISTDNNSVRVWDSTSGKVEYSFIKVDSADYFIQIPSGHFMSSAGASRRLHYVTPDLKIITFEQLDVKYNRPDLVLKSIGSRDTALVNSYKKAYLKRIKKLGIDTIAFSAKFGLPDSDFRNRDSIEFDHIKPQLTLQITGKDSTYALDRFNVWVNESPVFGMRGISLKGKVRNSIDTAVTVTLSGGSNRIETSITNVNGTESYRMPLFVNYTPEKPADEKLYFIGIGINEFAEPGHDLKWSVKDIRDQAKALKDKYGDKVSIDTLFDRQVSVSNIRALRKKLQSSRVNDKVIIAYSGHGLLSKDYDYYLSTYTVNFEKPEENGLPYEVLESLLDSIPARKKMMLIDACHSGEVDKEELAKLAGAQQELALEGVTGGRGNIRLNTGGKKLGMKNSFELMQQLFVNVGRSTGATIISAAAGTQFALEKNELQNGVFSYSILEYMKAHPHAKVSELKQYVNHRVTELTNGLQVPTTRYETNAVDWEVW